IDLYNDPLGIDADGGSVYLRDIWPTQAEVHETYPTARRFRLFRAPRPASAIYREVTRCRRPRRCRVDRCRDRYPSGPLWRMRPPAAETSDNSLLFRC